jgi:DNA-binding response OmpR family regulator
MTAKQTCSAVRAVKILTVTSTCAMKRILVVEDTSDIAHGLRNHLEIDGYEVAIADDGPTGLSLAFSWAPDLIILDLMLPGMDGYRVLRSIRERGSDVPVLILTARDGETDKVLGFRLGADDFVTKPFGVLELLARVAALLRRSRGRWDKSPASSVVALGSWEIDPAARTVHRNGSAVDLTPMEFDLLVALYRRQGAVASRAELLREVWGYAGAVQSRTVDTHIAELRRKLGDDGSAAPRIVTVRKAGYRLQVPEALREEAVRAKKAG